MSSRFFMPKRRGEPRRKAMTILFWEVMQKCLPFLNWEFIQQYLPLYEKAAWLTLRLGVMGILLSIAVGLACAVIQYEKIPVLRRVVAVYIEISRNTPLLIQLFFLYYGLPKIGIRTAPPCAALAGLAFLGGSYMAEAFRSGLEAVEPISGRAPSD